VTTLHFITSNAAKLLHARHLASRYGAGIRSKKYYGIAYREPRSLDRKKLLKKSYEDAHKRWRKSRGSKDDFFFIEDTSVIIDALSRNGKEYPGVDVKYWMRETSFESLDAQLRRKKNKRTAIVRSDVILHLPESFRRQHRIAEPILHFTGKTYGKITEKELKIATNLVYPWLDNRSFNKWFIPKGAEKPLSALPIEMADRFDIRKDSIGKMLEFLSKRNCFGDHPESDAQPVTKYLPGLLPPLLIVTGLPCAGKTSLGNYLSEEFSYYHIEASDFMKRAFYERHGLKSTLPIETFAEEALLKTPDIVVRQVLEEIERSKSELVVVTGFRSAKEIEMFERSYHGAMDIKCCYIDASPKIRFQRSVVRQRHDAVSSIAEFEKRDELQLKMGLGEVRKMLAGSTISNERTLPNFFNVVAGRFGLELAPFSWPTSRELDERPTSLEESILITLAVVNKRLPKQLSTTQIAKQLNKLFARAAFETSKNNVSRYFNFRPHPFYKVTTENGVVKYVLSATGLSRAKRLIATRWS
jgi:dephospho-CoA kinase/inosine/xanthosine triphosphate pyrophosphatase family protein